MNWRSFKDFVGLDTLRSRCSRHSGSFVADRSQGIWRAHDACIEAMETYPGRQIVLLGLDALSFRFLERYYHSEDIDQLYPATSVIPSTSTCCWTSVLTGLLPFEHGVHGVVFYEAAFASTIHALRPISFDLTHGPQASKGIPSLVDPEKHIFTTATTRFHRKTFSIGRLAFDTSGPLHIQICGSAANFVPDDYELLIQDPVKLVESNVGALRHRLAEGFDLGFAYFNFDTFLHEHEYDDCNLVDAVSTLLGYCRKMARDDGVIFILVSDHGMVKQTPTGDPCPFTNPALREMSYAFPGGAGRTLYFYIRPEKVNDAIVELRCALGNTAIVLPRDSYIREFLRVEPAAVSHSSRIGDVIAVATTPSFPSVMTNSLHEHGSGSEEEMFAALGIISE